DVGIALLGDLNQHRRLLVEPGNRAGVADGIIDVRDVGQPHEIALRALDNDVAELFGRTHLPVERKGLALALAVEDAGGTERVRRRYWPCGSAAASADTSAGRPTTR